jgi:hypothetical protein
MRTSNGKPIDPARQRIATGKASKQTKTCPSPITLKAIQSHPRALAHTHTQHSRTRDTCVCSSHAIGCSLLSTVHQLCEKFGRPLVAAAAGTAILAGLQPLDGADPFGARFAYTWDGVCRALNCALAAAAAAGDPLPAAQVGRSVYSQWAPPAAKDNATVPTVPTHFTVAHAVLASAGSNSVTRRQRVFCCMRRLLLSASPALSRAHEYLPTVVARCPQQYTLHTRRGSGQ